MRHEYLISSRCSTLWRRTEKKHLKKKYGNMKFLKGSNAPWYLTSIMMAHWKFEAIALFSSFSCSSASHTKWCNRTKKSGTHSPKIISNVLRSQYSNHRRNKAAFRTAKSKMQLIESRMRHFRFLFAKSIRKLC